MQPCAVARPEPSDVAGRAVEHGDVRRAVFDRGDLGFRPLETDGDLVGEAVGPIGRPGAEVRVADQQPAPPRVPALDHVRARARQRRRRRQLAGLPAGTTSSGWSLCRKSGSGLAQVEGDRPRRRVGLDPLGEIAALEAGCGQAVVLASRHPDGISSSEVPAAEASRRASDARTSSGVTGAPLEKRRFGRSLKRYVRPSGLGSGRSLARSATSVPARRAAGSPVGDQAVVDECTIAGRGPPGQSGIGPQSGRR